MCEDYYIKVFETNTQREPFTEWLLRLDSITRKRILVRIARLQAGNFGDCKQIDYELFELRCFFGSGYRIYFGIKHNNIVILLCGGNKDTQVHDIKKAKQYWNAYEEKINKSY